MRLAGRAARLVVIRPHAHAVCAGQVAQLWPLPLAVSSPPRRSHFCALPAVRCLVSLFCAYLPSASQPSFSGGPASGNVDWVSSFLFWWSNGEQVCGLVGCCWQQPHVRAQINQLRAEAAKKRELQRTVLHKREQTTPPKSGDDAEIEKTIRKRGRQNNGAIAQLSSKPEL